jgi:hypothetical protein
MKASNISKKLAAAKIEYTVLVSRIDLFGSESRNEIVNDLIDKCLDKIDFLERQLMPTESFNLLRTGA